MKICRPVQAVFTVVGAFLLSAILGSLAYGQCLSSGNPIGNRMIVKTTGNQILDAKFNVEATDIASVFGVNPNLFLFDDSGSPNAFASPQQTLPGYTGTVYFGATLVRNELWTMNQGEAAVAGIMAHEFAHILQIKKGLRAESRVRELQADYMAGYYLAHKGIIGYGSVPGFAKALFEKGDYQFTSPQHHGTPEERVSAMLAGFENGDASVNQAYDDGLDFVEGDSDSKSAGKEPTGAADHCASEYQDCLADVPSYDDCMQRRIEACMEDCEENYGYPEYACVQQFCNPDVGPNRSWKQRCREKVEEAKSACADKRNACRDAANSDSDQ